MESICLLMDGRIMLDNESLHSSGTRKPPIVYKMTVGSGPSSSRSLRPPPRVNLTPVDPSNFENLVQGLMTLGFERCPSEEALRASAYNADAAADALLVRSPSKVQTRPAAAPTQSDISVQDQLDALKPVTWTLERAVEFYRMTCGGKIDLAKQLLPDQA
jgi:hypothetical protein